MPNAANRMVGGPANRTREVRRVVLSFQKAGLFEASERAMSQLRITTMGGIGNRAYHKKRSSGLTNQARPLDLVIDCTGS